MEALNVTERPTDLHEKTTFSELLFGCALAVGGNILISISLNLTKYTHVSIENEPQPKHYTMYPLWWFGLALMGVGELGNFAAYAFAPASLVAPLGTSAVIANMFIAVTFLKEKLRVEDLFGCIFTIVGAYLLVNFSKTDEPILNAENLINALTEVSFIIYIVIEFLAFISLLTLKYRWHIENVLVLLLMVALLASVTVITVKGMSGMIFLSFLGQMQLSHPVFWVMLVTMVCTCTIQLKFLNQAMAKFNATIVVPTNFVFFTISAITAGIVFYKEFWGMAAFDVLMFLFGCIMCFVGVYFITVGRAEVSSTSDTIAALKKDGLLKYFPAWLIAKVQGENTACIPEERQAVVLHSSKNELDMSEDAQAESEARAPHSEALKTAASKSYGAVNSEL